MTCPLCGKQTKARGLRQHLNRCCDKNGITLADYRKKHWNVLYQPFHALVAKTYSLMDVQDNRFGWQWAMVPGGEGHPPAFINPERWDNVPANAYWGYCDIQANGNKPFYSMRVKRIGRSIRRPETYGLGPGPQYQFPHFKFHYRGQGTLAIHLKRKNRCLCLDVDSPEIEPVLKACAILRNLGLHPHIEFSGKKGYHIWLFFDNNVCEGQLQKLADRIVKETQLDYDLAYPLNNKLLKLPLGIHQATGNLASFVDIQTLQPLPGQKQIDYCLGIEQQPFPIKLIQEVHAYSAKTRQLNDLAHTWWALGP